MKKRGRLVALGMAMALVLALAAAWVASAATAWPPVKVDLSIQQEGSIITAVVWVSNEGDFDTGVLNVRGRVPKGARYVDSWAGSGRGFNAGVFDGNDVGWVNTAGVKAGGRQGPFVYIFDASALPPSSQALVSAWVSWEGKVPGNAASRAVEVGARLVEPLKLILFAVQSPLILGQGKGFFAEEGVRLDITMTRSSVEQIRGILAGTWDIAQTSPDNVIAYVESEGVDLAMFSGIERGQSWRRYGLFVQPEIKSVQDLRGRTLGVDALATGFAFLLRKMLLVNGLDLNKKDYELVSVGGTAQRFQALKDGTVAGSLMTPPWDDQARGEGFVSLVAAGDIMDSYLPAGWAGRRAWAADHSDLLVRFLRAYIKSVEWTANPSNRKEAVALLAKDQNISEEAAGRRIDVDMDPLGGAAIPEAALDLKGLDIVIKLRAEMGYLKEPLPPAEKYYDLTYYNRAIKK